MNKRKISPLIAYISIASIMLGTGYILGKNSIPLTRTSTVDNQADRIEKTPITILGDTFSGYSTFRANTFSEQNNNSNLKIQYEDEFDQATRARALGKKADLIVTTLDQFLLHQPKGTIVGLIDKTVGADAVVLNTKQYPNLKTLNDIPKLTQENLKIVYSADTPSEYLAKLLDIKFSSFSLSNFELVEVIEATEAYQALNSDPNVAIAVLWEPFVSRAKEDGNTVILSSKDVPNSIIDVIVASETIQNKPIELSTFLNNYYQHIDNLIENTNAMNSQIAEDGELSVQDASNIALGIDFFSAIESKKWMVDGTLQQRIYATSGILTLTGELPNLPKKQLFSIQHITQAVANSEKRMVTLEKTKPHIAKILKGEKSSTAIEPSKDTVQSAQNVGSLSVRGDISFSRGSAILTPGSKDTLNKVAQELGDFNEQTTAVNVIGHTSKTGLAKANKILSQQRAQVVTEYLKAQGVQLKVVAEGKGFANLLPGISPENPLNQRTEIQLKRIGN